MDTSKQAQQSYDAMVKKASPNSPILSNCIKAFVSGGLICVLGQALLMLYTKKGISEADAALWVSITLIGISAVLTAFGLYEKLGKFGFGPYINHMVTSQEAGHEKPHPDFMALCIEKAGCRPDEIVFMGDNFRKDVEGSVLAGMHGVWYRAKEKPLPEDAKIGPESYQIIRHYDELIPYIKSIR